MKLSSIAPLVPIGAETRECESLSSYVQRLAAVHGTLPGPLLHRLVSWMAHSNWSMVGTWARRTGVVRLGKNINGFRHADHWLRIITPLTGRSDLLRLTTRPWDAQFPTRNFLRPTLAWCPHCLSEDLLPYHRLIWALQPVTSCVKHLSPLITRCPSCGQRIPVIHERSGVTHCPQCAGDLRNFGKNAHQSEPNSFSQWSAAELGVVVAACGSPDILADWSPTASLGHLQKSRGINNAAEFAQFLGTSRITAWYWLSGAARPSLQACLRIYFRFGVSLARELVGRSPCSDPKIKPNLQHEIYLRDQRTSRKINWGMARAKLKLALRIPQAQVKSLSAIAREMAIDRRLLRQHEPSLCRKIGRRYLQLLRSQKAAREKILRREMLQASTQLSRHQLPSTQQNIAKILGRAGLFCRHDARQIYSDLRRNRFSLTSRATR